MTASEPLVGEIRAVRTFRLGPGGRLHPLFDTAPWSADVTVARCRVTPDDPAHVVPDCTCGLYASADALAAAQYPQARHVLAVVAVWGGVVVGTRGVRAQYGRVEALWLSAAVPPGLVAEATARYPAARLFRDRDTMLRAHPPTVLQDHEPATPSRVVRRRAMLGAALAAALVLGVVAGAVGTGAGTAVAALAMLTAVVEVAVLGAWHAHRVRRDAATFPAVIVRARHDRGRRRPRA